MTPKAGESEQQLQSVGAQDMTRQKQLYGTNQSTLDQFSGPIANSPYYKSLVSAGTAATTGAYKSAQASVRARAHAAGYDYTQPVEQGSEAELGNEEASALSKVPTNAMIEAVQPTLQASGIRAGEENTYNPTAPLNDATQSYNQRQQIGRQFLSSLVKAGVGAISPVSKAFGA